MDKIKPLYIVYKNTMTTLYHKKYNKNTIL